MQLKVGWRAPLVAVSVHFRYTLTRMPLPMSDGLRLARPTISRSATGLFPADFAMAAKLALSDIFL